MSGRTTGRQNLFLSVVTVAKAFNSETEKTINIIVEVVYSR